MSAGGRGKQAGPNTYMASEVNSRTPDGERFSSS